MTEKNFEKAKQLKEEISYLLALDDVLVRAAVDGHMLAAVKGSFSSTEVVEKVCLTDDMFKHFRASIAAEVLKRDRMFENL